MPPLEKRLGLLREILSMTPETPPDRLNPAEIQRILEQRQALLKQLPSGGECPVSPEEKQLIREILVRDRALSMAAAQMKLKLLPLLKKASAQREQPRLISLRG